MSATNGNRDDVPQFTFDQTFKFVSACTHCGKPMGHMSLDSWTREPGPFGAFVKREVWKVWIDPEHDCDFLKIEPKQTAISA